MTKPTPTDTAPARRLSVGAEPQPGGGVHFAVWAPNARRVEVVLHDRESPDAIASAHPLERSDDGRFGGLVAEATVGTLYRFRLDGAGVYPDLASRFQPFGVHGPSQVVDPSAFPWTDADWRGLEREGQVVYEMHVGTFTRAGTFAAAAERLEHLRDLGVTCLEMMPVNAFSGDHGWGYDGVALFAVFSPYGTPDDLRRFIDRAHALGIGVLLDVVYNHVGPDGAYFKAYAEEFFHPDRPANEWGQALNFDGPNCGPVRTFFLDNAAHWIAEYHLDGLRLDATQAIEDESAEHLITCISRRAREAGGSRRVLIVGENEPQDTGLLRPAEKGGGGLDALWNDDFHHAVTVALTGRSEAYYSDYTGSPQELLSACKRGFLFQGQFSRWQQHRRGSPALGLEASRFFTFLENHDQVANTAQGDRLARRASPARVRALTAFWLLSPQTPMFFQGQEYGSTRPFFYFAGHGCSELRESVKRGRADFLAQFPSIARSEATRRLADPCAPETFTCSILDWDECTPENPTLRLHRDLLRLRREDLVFRRQDAARIDGAVLGPEAFVVRFFDDGGDDRLLFVNLGRDLYPCPGAEPLLAPPPGRVWEATWNSEHPDYGGSGIAPLEADRSWRLPGGAAAVLRAVVDDGRSSSPKGHREKDENVERDVHESKPR